MCLKLLINKSWSYWTGCCLHVWCQRSQRELRSNFLLYRHSWEEPCLISYKRRVKTARACCARRLATSVGITKATVSSGAGLLLLCSHGPPQPILSMRQCRHIHCLSHSILIESGLLPAGVLTCLPAMILAYGGARAYLHSCAVVAHKSCMSRSQHLPLPWTWKNMSVLWFSWEVHRALQVANIPPKWTIDESAHVDQLGKLPGMPRQSLIG